MNVPSLPREYVHVTSDGTALVADLWEAEDPRGIVVLRTPYDAHHHAAIGRSWNHRGYHCVIQDVRGRYRSHGAWRPYAHEGADGADTIAGIRDNFPNLPVLSFGASYAAHAAVESARVLEERGEPALAAIIAAVPALGLAETAWDSAGNPLMAHRIGWWHEHGRSSRSEQPLASQELQQRVSHALQRGVHHAAKQWGWSEHVLAQWDNLWRAQPVNIQQHYADVASPLLVITGTEDFFTEDARRLAYQWPGESHVISGPWGHRLGRDMTEPLWRERLQTQGGIGSMIDAWLAVYGLGEPGAQSTLPPIETAECAPMTSIFDPVAGQWRHERNAT